MVARLLAEFSISIPLLQNERCEIFPSSMRHIRLVGLTIVPTVGYKMYPLDSVGYHTPVSLSFCCWQLLFFGHSFLYFALKTGGT